MRILVTNDDGIDSIGLHILARALVPLGEVVVGAPDSEYSGSSASLGQIHPMRPEMRRAQIEGIASAWAMTAPPALCILLARLGAFGEPFDLVVSGINPGANVGRAIYHSGTVGAALTARNAGITGIAVSQTVDVASYAGQAGLAPKLENQRWHSAAAIAAKAVEAIATKPLPEPAVLNINVPNLELADMGEPKLTKVGERPLMAASTLERAPKPGHAGAYTLSMKWNTPDDGTTDPDTDTGALSSGHPTFSWLSRLAATDLLGSAHVIESVAELTRDH